MRSVEPDSIVREIEVRGDIQHDAAEATRSK